MDCWHIPGGGVEEGETGEQAIVREVKEETGIDISPYEIVLLDDAGKGESEKTLENGEKVLCKMKFDVYKVEINDKTSEEIEVKLFDELNKYAWFGIAEIKNKKLTPPFGRIV